MAAIPERFDLSVLFADIAGSSRLYEKLGDVGALRLIERGLGQMRAVARDFRGRVVKTIGDEVLALFSDAETAMEAASELQHRFMDLPAYAGIKMAVRIGFHHGPVILDSDDVFGDTVNIASRLVGQAKGGQILISAGTHDLLSGDTRKNIRKVESVAVKGKGDAFQAFEVLWQNANDVTQLDGRWSLEATDPGLPQPSEIDCRLRLALGNRVIDIDLDHPAIIFGRDLNSDFLIPDTRASRLHGTLEYRRGRFVFSDQSTNGSFVTFAEEAEFRLRREAVKLRSRGRICFGHPFVGDGPGILHFEVLP